MRIGIDIRITRRQGGGMGRPFGVDSEGLLYCLIVGGQPVYFVAY